jgi:metal-responsive CopG/Arc/MetJ family transcriptional regulator
MGEFQKEPLIIKRRGEDGHRMITIRIKEDTLSSLDKMSTEINCSRNELINTMINYGLKNIIIE